MKVRTLQRFSTFIGFVLFAVSTVFTVKLLVAFGGNGFEKLIYALFGVAVQSCQTLLFIFSLALIWSGKKAWAVPGFLLFGILFILSLAGTIGFFAVGNREKVDASYKGDLKYSEMKTRIAMIDKEINSCQGIISDYAKIGVVTRGVKPTQQRLDELRNEREKAYNELVNYQPTPATDALYEQIAMFFGCSKDQAKSAIFAFYALALDLSAVFLLGYGLGCKKWFSENADVTGRSDYESVQPDVVQKPETVQKSVRNPVQKPETVQNSVQNPVQKHEAVQNLYKNTEANGYLDPKTKEALQEYIFWLWEAAKSDGSLAGRKLIADKSGITNRICNKCHEYLKNKGLVYVEGLKCFPAVSKEEMLEALGIEQEMRKTA